MTPRGRAHLRGSAAWGCVLLSTLFTGCVGAEIWPGQDPYYQQDHMWCGNYAIDLEGARVATLTALTHLKMPVYQEAPLGYGILLDTRTPDNFEARVILSPLGEHGQSTRIGVRVTGFGTHREVCARLLDEITRHLEAGNPPLPGVLPASSPIASGPPSSASAQPALPPHDPPR